MHIIFGNIVYWQVPILIVLKYLNFNVFYLSIDVKSDLKKNKISIRKYQISIKKVSLKKEYYKINTKNRGPGQHPILCRRDQLRVLDGIGVPTLFR